MLRQKRFSQKASMNFSLNLYANQNMSLLPSTLDQNRKSFAMVEPKLSKKSLRSGLGQIQKNSNIRRDIKQEVNLSKFANCTWRDRSESAVKIREQDQLFQKISDLIKNQEEGAPICHSSKSKRFLKRNDRPYTSLSIRNRRVHDSNISGKYQFVLDLTPRDEPQEVPDPSKVSTSRALMNYSKVYRNSSGDRFKVRRDKHLHHFALISTQRVVLQQKLKKEKKEMERVPDKPVKSYRRQREESKPALAKHRYAEQEQQYQIDGWEYFE